VDTVSNPYVFRDGYDKESDDAFRARIKAYIQSLPRSTVSALESCVLGRADPETGAIIRYSKAVEDIVERGNVQLYIDDGSGTAENTEAVTAEIVTAGLAGPPAGSAVGGETELWLNYGAVKDSLTITMTSSDRGALVRDTDYFLNPASGKIIFDPALIAAEVITASYTRYIGLIAEAQKIVDGDPLDRANYPGYRAAGIFVAVKTPQVLIQTFSLLLVIKEGYVSADVQTAVSQAIIDYVNTLPISGDVLRAEIFRRIMSVAGVYDVILTTPANNVILLDDQLARTSIGNIIVA
jgi:hypothetical protein